MANLPEVSPLKIGIMRFSAIGDVVLASSCLSLLRLLGIDAEVCWVGREPSAALLRAAFPKLKLIVLEPSYDASRVAKELEGLDFLVDLQSNLRSRQIARHFKKLFGRPVYHCSKSYFQRSRLVLEGRMYGRRRSLPQKALNAPQPQYVLMADALLHALARQLPEGGLKAVDLKACAPFFPIDKAKLEFTPKLESLREGSWLAVAPGASYETKRAPLALLKEILTALSQHEKLAKSEKLGLVLLGDKFDRAFCEELRAQIPWKGPILNLAGDLSLWDNAKLLAFVSCLIANDSSLIHIAEAVGTPVAALFGPTIEGFGFGPHLAESRAFSAALGCRPCSKHGKTPCRFLDHRCFFDIRVDELTEFVAALLAKKRGGKA